MAFCRNCGAELEENQDVCFKCGTSQRFSPTNNTVVDNGGFVWGLLGFCVPVAGLILYLVWNQERPNTAKAAGIGALISVVGSVFLYIFYAIVMFGLMSSRM